MIDFIRKGYISVCMTSDYRLSLTLLQAIFLNISVCDVRDFFLDDAEHNGSEFHYFDELI